MLTLVVLQLQTGVNIVKNEGVLALYSGLGPAIGRGLFYGGEHSDNSYPHAGSIWLWCCCTYSQHYDAVAPTASIMLPRLASTRPPRDDFGTIHDAAFDTYSNLVP